MGRWAPSSRTCLPSLAMLGSLLGFAIYYRLLPARALVKSSTVFASVYGAVVLLAVVDSTYPGDTGLSAVPHGQVIDRSRILRDSDRFAVADCGPSIGLHHWRGAVDPDRNRGRSQEFGRLRRVRSSFLCCNRQTVGKAGDHRRSHHSGSLCRHRFAWAAGIPLGIEPAFLQQMQNTGLVYAGLGLASMALLGVLLTLGLIQRWGSVFPRWIPFLGGRRVPVLLAVIPSGFVSLIAIPAGAEMIRVFAVRGAGRHPDGLGQLGDDWADPPVDSCGAYCSAPPHWPTPQTPRLLPPVRAQWMTAGRRWQRMSP